MSNDISLEVRSLKDIVSEKVKSQFAGLIPDDVWKSMIESELKNFTTDYLTRGHHGYRKAPLMSLIEEEISLLAKEKLKEAIRSEEFQSAGWNNGNQIASDAIKKLISENAEQIMTSLIGGIVQSMLSNLQYR